MLKRYKRLFTVVVILFMSITGAFAEYPIYIPENTADNPRLVNLSPEQFRTLDVIEKRIFGKTYYGENTVDRVERLELELYEEIQKGSISQRLASLRLDSTKSVISGTAMTPMMNDVFNTKYINSSSDIRYHDDVGIIDGLIRAWWPDFYADLNEFRKYKEANFH